MSRKKMSGRAGAVAASLAIAVVSVWMIVGGCGDDNGTNSGGGGSNVLDKGIEGNRNGKIDASMINTPLECYNIPGACKLGYDIINIPILYYDNTSSQKIILSLEIGGTWVQMDESAIHVVEGGRSFYYALIMDVYAGAATRYKVSYPVISLGSPGGTSSGLACADGEAWVGFSPYAPVYGEDYDYIAWIFKSNGDGITASAYGSRGWQTTHTGQWSVNGNKMSFQAGGGNLFSDWDYKLSGNTLELLQGNIYKKWKGVNPRPQE